MEQISLLARAMQVAAEPVRSQAGHLFQLARLVKQVGNPGHHHQVPGNLEALLGLAVQVRYSRLQAANQQQGGRFYLGQHRHGQVGPSLAQGDRCDCRDRHFLPDQLPKARISGIFG